MRPAPPAVRRSTRLAGVVAAAALVLVSTPAQAAQTAQNSWTVPRRATITISGHGYGHGHGMSQYGAEGAARQGLGYRQIIDFYYPSASWGTARGRVRVLITADTSDDLVVEARPGLTLHDTAASGSTALPDNGASRWRVTRASDGANHVAYLTRRWHDFATLRGEGEFFAGGDPITLVTPAGTRAYRGRLRRPRRAPGRPRATP